MSQAQTKIYIGNTTFYRAQVATYEYPYLYEGPTQYTSDITYTLTYDALYVGRTQLRSNMIYEYKNGKIYKVGYPRPVARWVDNKLYLGEFIYETNVIANLYNNRIYRKRSHYQSDILYTLKGTDITPLLIFLLVNTY